MKNLNSISRFINFSLFSIFIFGVSTLSAYSQQMSKMNADSTKIKSRNASDKMGQMSDDKDLAHPFFSHMGMPHEVGSYSLRLSALATRTDGKTKGDFAFHFETGLSKFIGLHIRNDRFLQESHTEIMFQFAAIKSRDGMSGFSPIIEFEIPTRKGATRINTLVGFSTAIAGSHLAFNQAFHYNPYDDMVEGEASLVFKAGKRVFLIAEILGEKMPDEQAIINLVGGVKVKLNENFMLGIGYQQSVTTNRDFSSQFILQPDMEWKSNHTN
jgi:hypothetical protein